MRAVRWAMSMPAFAVDAVFVFIPPNFSTLAAACSAPRPKTRAVLVAVSASGIRDDGLAGETCETGVTCETGEIHEFARRQDVMAARRYGATSHAHCTL